MEISNPVALPPAPSSLHGEPDDLYGSKVVVVLSDNTQFKGALELIYQEKRLVKVAQEKSGKILTIPFGAIHLIRFRQNLALTGTPVEAETNSASIAGRQDTRPYHITFQSGHEVKGEACTVLEIDGNLTLFVHHDKGAINRFFVPRENIKAYGHGKKLGEVLTTQHNVPEERVNAGLDKQAHLRGKTLGNYFLERGIVTDRQLQSALSKQTGEYKVRIGEILMAEGLISQDQLDSAIELQRQDRSKKLGDILVEMGATTEEAIYQALAAKLGIPFIKLDNFEIDTDAVSEIPAQIAQEQVAMPIAFNGDRLVVAVANLSGIEVMNVLSFVSGRKIDFVISPLSGINDAIEQYYGSDIATEIVTKEVEKELSGVSARDKESSSSLERMANERPIVRLVHQIFADAAKRRASDIHLRPKAKSVELLYRIDGSMIHVRDFGKSLHPGITSRIKVLAKMDIAQRRLPQDGRIQLCLMGQNRDMRISMMPTVHGESTVVRLLAESASLKPIEDVGFDPEDTARFKELLHRGGGIILVTGPTGSGKTTTLYSALNELITLNHNIITVEDPVEIQLDGVEQVQVQKEIDFTFARALRNILRHDPDVIMMGEIRDEETAGIAVQSAQTGHLVLSTLHTNTAAGTISRLKQMNVPPYLVASTVLGVIAQRLIRKICPHCRQEEEVEPFTREILGIGENEKFQTGVGCQHCHQTGYSGRLAVYELMTVNEAIKHAILSDGSEEEITQAAIKSGMQTITNNALGHARAGETSISEVHKIFTT